ncbi:MAG TPA: helix-turn-helix domain-containing protein [Candidatus Limnocylindrales bacterium]
MSDVKTLGHRARQALATRRAVAAAARRLFAERGYTATTIEAISTAAEIPVQTIYSAFGSKRAILEEVRVAWIEESDVAALHAAALATPDPRARLRAAAHWTRRQFELGHDVIAAYQEASRVDEEAAAVWRRALRGREEALRQLVDSLGDAVRRELSPRRALDAYIALTLPELFGTLVVDRDWTPDDYERWLADCLERELLADRV